MPSRIIRLLEESFCSPCDSIETKRRQCIYVGVLLFCWGAVFTTLIISILARTLWNGLWAVPAGLALLTLTLIHSRRTRGFQSSRVMFAGLIGYNFYMTYVRGGFTYVSIATFSGLIAPILSMFVSNSPNEWLVWLGLHFTSNIFIFVLENTGRLPDVAFDPHAVSISAAANVIPIQILYALCFWFVTHVYGSELKARHSLEKELNLFTRLSHEFCTPIAVITGIVEMMGEWQSSFSLDQRRMLSDLASAARRLGNVSSDLLAFQVGNSGDTLSLEEMVLFNLREVIDTVIGFHLPTTNASKVSVYVDIPADIPLEVTGAKTRLTSILDHLFENSAKFTKSGSVTIQVRCNHTSDSGGALDELREYHFEIRDTGVGMSDEELAHIFDPFMQSQLGPSREFDGIGLGLTLAQRMAQKWGRNITASSEGHGKGSTFSFSCPLTAYMQPRKSDHGLISVLVVDDDAFSTRGIVQTCSALGLVTKHAALKDLTPELCSSANAIILSLPMDFDSTLERLAADPNSNSTASGVVMGLNHLRTSVLPATIGLIGASSVCQNWWVQQTNWIPIRKPPTLAELQSHLRPLWLVPTSSSRGLHGMKMGSGTMTGLTTRRESRPRSITSPGLIPLPPAPATTVPSFPAPPPPPLLTPPPPPPPAALLTATLPSTNNFHSSTAHSFSCLEGISSTIEDLPRLSEASGSVGARTLSAAAAASSLPRVLVVDDSPLILRLLTSMIKSIPVPAVTLETTTEGETALRLISAHHYALVICDYNMPGLNGADVAARIRQMGLRIPIVGITAAADARAICLAAGMDEVIFKPFTQEKIQAILTQYIH